LVLLYIWFSAFGIYTLGDVGLMGQEPEAAEYTYWLVNLYIVCNS